jgi:5-methylcytosine-specific restriction endonuclease McrBC regulatory subunit McrC
VRMRDPEGRIVRVLERQRVPLPPHLDTARVRERLVATAEGAGMWDALEHRRRGLFAKGAVGVVDIGAVAVEILPKTREGATPDEGRAFLVDLLRFVGRDRGPFAAAAAGIRDGAGGLVEVLYAWAVATVARHADTGLPRRYMPRTEASTAVRGRIDMKRVALARPGRDFELVIRHAPLSADNDVVRALRWLVREVASRTRRSETRRSALTLLGELRGVADVEANAAHFDRILLRPLEEHWAPLLGFARSLARQRCLDPAAAGGQPSVAVLFTLHDLFERALRRVLHDHGPDTGLYPARIPRHLLLSHEGSELVRLKPDYVLRLADATGDRLAVGDAKWKDIWTQGGAPAPGPDDVYQLVAYMAAGRTGTGFLFAPLVGGSSGERLRVFRHTLAGTGATLDIIGVHVPTLLRPEAAGEELRRDLCAAIAATIRKGGAGAPVPVADPAA